MSIVDEIRKKIRANGGSAGKVKDIASGVKALETGGQGVFYRLDATMSKSGNDTVVTVSKTVLEVFELIEQGYIPYLWLTDETISSDLYYATLHLGYCEYYESQPYAIVFCGVSEKSTAKVPYWEIYGEYDSSADAYIWTSEIHSN